VNWVGAGAVVVGSAQNASIALWTLGDGDMNGAEATQTLSFAPEDEVYNFTCAAYPAARLVLLANLRKQSVYAVHLAKDGAGFDYVSEFSVTMPVLSFTALREDDDELSLQLYCMQTQAIQQYALHLDRCRPGRQRERERERGGERGGRSRGRRRDGRDPGRRGRRRRRERRRIPRDAEAEHADTREVAHPG
jgi:hypothetical protein